MDKVKDIRVAGRDSARELVGKLGSTGFQASELKAAVGIIREMREADATIFLAFTANMMASGLRGVLTQMVDEGLADAVITSGGSIDHDIIRSYKPYLLGSFNADDIELHRKGVNRIGNILVPNDRYMLLERKMRRVFTHMEKKTNVFTPSELNNYIGSILPKHSFLNTCYRKKIPVFCPGMVDSAIGMHLFFFKQKHREFIMDTAEDFHQLADIVFAAKQTGGIVLGGGISKHHLIGANLMRGGLDYAVYITTAQEYDGSLSGAHPKEGKSWGKIKGKGRTATVYGDTSILLPLIIAGYR
ncbi:MAG: deoxyhypusine synthase [Candidatus Altiarchaeota archaeon]